MAVAWDRILKDLESFLRRPLGLCDCSTLFNSLPMTQIYTNPLASVHRSPTLLMLLPSEHKAWCEQVCQTSHSIHFVYLIFQKVCPRRVQCCTCHLSTSIQRPCHWCIQRSPGPDLETWGRLGSDLVRPYTKRCVRSHGNLRSFYGRSASQCAFLPDFWKQEGLLDTWRRREIYPVRLIATMYAELGVCWCSHLAGPLSTWPPPKRICTHRCCLWQMWITLDIYYQFVPIHLLRFTPIRLSLQVPLSHFQSNHRHRIRHMKARQSLKIHTWYRRQNYRERAP